LANRISDSEYDNAEKTIESSTAQGVETQVESTHFAHSGNTTAGDDLNSTFTDSALDDPRAIEMSAPFVGKWVELISTTNWEKGKIISQWRSALQETYAPSSSYSDEAWCRQVGGVTPQHVGRLRRVYDRFHSSYTSYAGLYWSHFLSALDWEDAEMWLEGAAQSKWSVSQMRRTRWETLGGDPTSEPRDSEVSATTEDEDFTPLAEADPPTATSDGPRAVAEGPLPEGPDFGDEDSASPSAEANAEVEDSLAWEETAPPESPFASLPSLPVDLAEALEQFKLGIIRHRASGWSEVSQSDVLKALDALKNFVAQ
jgi:hypothetical protein